MGIQVCVAKYRLQLLLLRYKTVKTIEREKHARYYTMMSPYMHQNIQSQIHRTGQGHVPVK